MAQFSNNAITDLGKLLLAEIQMGGGVFDATRIVMGSGYLPGGQTIGTMTDVVTPVISLEINKKEKTPDGKAVLGAYYSNKEVETAFYWRELAVYARVAYQQPDGSYTYGNEVLYSYGNAGSSADYMAAYSSNTAVEKQIDLVTWIGNETEIYLNIDGGVYVTVNQVVNMITQVENRMNATLYEFDYRSNRDIIILGERLDDLKARVDGHDVDIASLKAYDLQVHSRLNEVSARVDSVWDALFTEITENPAVVDFDTLEGFTLSGGVWNKPLHRLEV
jgi:hypothetical protein